MDLVKMIADIRANIVKLGNAHPCNIDATIKREDIAGVPCYWLFNENTVNDKLIIYIHGGSNILGSFESHKNAA